MRPRIKRRGNVNWGRPGNPPVVMSMFERLLIRLKLETREQIKASPELYRWVMGNYQQHYVPEWLLDEMGITAQFYGEL